MKCIYCEEELTRAEKEDVVYLETDPVCTGCKRDRETDSDAENGPTGHGDICWSDADPGL